MRTANIRFGMWVVGLIGGLGTAGSPGCSADTQLSAGDTVAETGPVADGVPTQLLSEDRTEGAPGSAVRLRNLINRLVGGIGKLQVPATLAALPQPRQPNGKIDPRFMITEAKRYLGKMLFADPIRNQRIRPQFGGIPATRQTMSCATCHNGLFASKAGQILNLGVCGEGISFTDEIGVVHARRRRDESIPGCAGPDVAPTLTDTFAGTPQEINGNGDAIDSVARLSPNVLAAGFSTRLLAGGKAGDTGPGGFHRNDNPPLEDLTFALQDAHRMLEQQSAAILANPAFVQAFREAFPLEATAADASHDMTKLVNDDMVAEAVATFLRTVITHDTPWDRFLAGDDTALTASQREGARLFFTSAKANGAGCYTCHSGPALNKQLGDEAGLLVEENFVNLGLLDHNLQALNGKVFAQPGLRDRGRAEITGNPAQNFEFKVQTIRQIKDARQFMHNGLFPSVESVVRYFNDGVAQDQTAGGAGQDPSFSWRFSNPRGAGQVGLGLTNEQIHNITDFIENGLYDRAFVTFDPGSPTDTLLPNERDMNYSKYHRSLAAKGAVDGRVISGLGFINNDPLSRRDLGIDPPVDVSAQLSFPPPTITSTDDSSGVVHRYVVTNTGSKVIDTNLLVAASRIDPQGVRMLDSLGGSTEISASGVPYARKFLASDQGTLLPGASTVVTLVFYSADGRTSVPANLSYTPRFYSGQGKLP